MPNHAQAVWMQDVVTVPVASRVPPRADVVVIGGGLTGLSAALTLSQSGARVAVLEAGRVMDGASGRNGGQVLTGLNPGLAALTARFGPALARDWWRQSLAAVDWVEELIRRYDIECDWHRGGHLALAPDGDTLIALSREADALAQAGFPGHLLNADAVRARLGFGAWPGGLYDPASGTANPYRLGMGLAMAAIAHGAVLVEGAPARIDPGQGPPYVVRTPVGNVSASDVLVAANAWLGDLLPALRGRVKRVFGAVLATDPLPSALAQRLLPGRPAVFEESDRVLHFQKTADGRLVFGGRAAAATAATEEALPRLFREVVPELGSADRHLTVWRGPLAIVADGLPRVGVTPRGIMWAGGYTGHGVALAVWLGREAARWMAEGTKPHWPSDLPPRWPRPAIGRFRRLRSVSAGAGELS